MVRGAGNSHPMQQPITQTQVQAQAQAQMADQIRCPGVSMMVREGLSVDQDGYVKFGDVANKMQEKFGYDESFAKFLLTVFGTTSGTDGLQSTHDNWKNQRLNIWDLSSEKSGGQHVRSLPFRREDGSVNETALKEALDRFAPDGKVTLDSVAKMVNAYGQSGVIDGQERGAGIKGRLDTLGEQQTAGEVMLLFSAFAKRDTDGKVYMDRSSFEQVYSGHMPTDFSQERDGLGLGTVKNWTGLTVKTGTKVIAGDISSTAQSVKEGVGSAFAKVKDGISGLFRREDPVIEGADRALGERRGQIGASSTMLEGISKSGVCPAMPGAVADASTQTVRNPQEAAQLHTPFLKP